MSSTLPLPSPSPGVVSVTEVVIMDNKDQNSRQSILYVLLPLLIILSTLFLILVVFLIGLLWMRRKRSVRLVEDGGPLDLSRNDGVIGEGGIAGVESRWLEQATPDQQEGYRLAKDFQTSYPPGSIPTDITLSQFLSIQEKGVSAWCFEPDYESNLSLFVESRTEITFLADGPGMAAGEGGGNTVLSNLPIPKLNEVYYWEAKMYDLPSSTEVVVGLCTKPYPSFRFPGYCRTSVGYFSSDGFKCHNFPFTAASYGLPLREGDVLGVGYRPRTGTVFFTKNGRKLDDCFTGLSTLNLFPAIGANGACTVHVNLGQAGFVFIEANVKKWGLAPMVGTLAPPPAYGSERGSILLEAGYGVPGATGSRSSITEGAAIARQMFAGADPRSLSSSAGSSHMPIPSSSSPGTPSRRHLRSLPRDLSSSIPAQPSPLRQGDDRDDQPTPTRTTFPRQQDRYVSPTDQPEPRRSFPSDIVDEADEDAEGEYDTETDDDDDSQTGSYVSDNGRSSMEMSPSQNPPTPNPMDISLRSLHPHAQSSSYFGGRAGQLIEASSTGNSSPNGRRRRRREADEELAQDSAPIPATIQNRLQQLVGWSNVDQPPPGYSPVDPNVYSRHLLGKRRPTRSGTLRLHQFGAGSSVATNARVPWECRLNATDPLKVGSRMPRARKPSSGRKPAPPVAASVDAADDDLDAILDGDSDGGSKDKKPKDDPEAISAPSSSKPRMLKFKISAPTNSSDVPSALTQSGRSSHSGSKRKAFSEAAGPPKQRKEEAIDSEEDPLADLVDDDDANLLDELLDGASPEPEQPKKKPRLSFTSGKFNNRSNRGDDHSENSNIEDSGKTRDATESRTAASLSGKKGKKGKSSKLSAAVIDGDPDGDLDDVAVETSFKRDTGKSLKGEVDGFVSTSDQIAEGSSSQQEGDSKKKKKKKPSVKRPPGVPGPGKNWRKGLKKGMTRPGIGPASSENLARPAGNDIDKDLEHSSPSQPAIGKRKISEIAYDSSSDDDAPLVSKVRRSSFAESGDEGSKSKAGPSAAEAGPSTSSTAPTAPAPKAAAAQRKRGYIRQGPKVDLSAPADPEVLGHLVYKNHIPAKAIPIFKIPPVPSKAEEREQRRTEEDDERKGKKGVSFRPASKPLDVGPPARKWVNGRRAIIGIAGACMMLNSWISDDESPWKVYRDAKLAESSGGSNTRRIGENPDLYLGSLPGPQLDGDQPLSSPGLATEDILNRSSPASEIHQPLANVLASKIKEPRAGKRGTRGKPKTPGGLKGVARAAAAAVASPLHREVVGGDNEDGDYPSAEETSTRASSPVISKRGKSSLGEEIRMAPSGDEMSVDREDSMDVDDVI